MRGHRRRTYGEGTVYQKRPGYWCAQIRQEGQRFTGSGETAEAARRSLAATLAAREQIGLARCPTETYVADFLTNWIADMRATQAMKPSAWRRYESIVRLHLVPALGPKRLDELTKRDVAGLIDDARQGRVTGRPLQNTSLHHVHAVLRAALETAVTQDLVDRNVARLVKAPPMRHRDKVILDRDQTGRLLAAARGARLEAAIVLGIATGMREGEILGLRRRDIDFSQGTLSVETNAGLGYSGAMELGALKTEAARRVIVLPDMALNALRQHLTKQDPPSMLVFPSLSGELLSGTNFLTRHFHPILKKAGLPKMPFHDLRHSAATLLKEMGVDEVTISRTLGHSTPAITMKLYGHVTSRLKREAANKMDSILNDRHVATANVSSTTATGPSGSQIGSQTREGSGAARKPLVR